MAGTAATNLASVNISNTYYGVLHAGGQNLPPTGQAQIYDGYGTFAAIRVGANCNGVTICGPLSCGSVSASSLSVTAKLSASTQFDIFNLLNVLHPVGSVIFTFDSGNPGLRVGWTGTTWSQVSQGRYLGGVGSSTDTNGVSNTFIAGNNSGRFTQDISVPDHYHGTGAFTGANNDDFVVINGGWDDGRGWTRGRWIPGSSGDNRTLNGNKQLYGAITSYPVAKSSYSIDIEPPACALYVWQRIS